MVFLIRNQKRSFCVKRDSNLDTLGSLDATGQSLQTFLYSTQEIFFCHPRWDRTQDTPNFNKECCPLRSTNYTTWQRVKVSSRKEPDTLYVAI